jgi:hypothetical protein
MTVGRSAGLIAAALLALSPFHLWFSQEARAYSLLALAATLYAATCFHYIRAPSLPRGAWVSLAGLALVYSHPYGTLDWIAIAVAFALFVLPSSSSRTWTMLVWAASNVAIAAGFAPWALVLAGHSQAIAAKGFWIPPLTFPYVRHELVTVAGGRLLAAVILIGIFLSFVGRVRRDVALLCVWITVPVAIGIVASILSRPIFMDRYAIGSLPPLLLLSAFGWTKYAKHWHGATLLAAVVATAALALSLHGPRYKDDWRGVASFLEKRERPTDCVLIVPAYLKDPLNYYKRNSSCERGADKVANLPAEIPASVLFGVFSLKEVEVSELERAAIVDELRRRGWHDCGQTDFRGTRVITFER